MQIALVDLQDVLPILEGERHAVRLTGKLSLLPQQYQREPSSMGIGGGKNEAAGFDGGHPVHRQARIELRHPVDAVGEGFWINKYPGNIVEQNAGLRKVWHLADGCIQNAIHERPSLPGKTPQAFWPTR